MESDEPLPARQPRSQATTERLLDAARDLLAEGGADAATLRAIADRAGVSLGIVYRRFPDKDAVLRAVYTRFFDGMAGTNERALSSEKFRCASLTELATLVVTGIAHGYRVHRALLRALILYARTHPDAEFRRRATALNTRAFAGLQRAFDAHRKGMTHSEPAIAVPFAISAAAAVLQARILFDDPPAEPPLTHAELVAEATRLLLGYLGRAPGRRAGSRLRPPHDHV